MRGDDGVTKRKVFRSVRVSLCTIFLDVAQNLHLFALLPISTKKCFEIRTS